MVPLQLPIHSWTRLAEPTFTEEQLADIRGGLTAEEYRSKLIREWCEN